MLLATAGSDNVVKVWRRPHPTGNNAECVFSISGHYDAIRSVAFDQSAVFLISAGEDTNVIVWRVRPSSPDAPAVPNVDKVDRFAIAISWAEPLANGAKITHYIVRTQQLSVIPGGRGIEMVPEMEVQSKYTTAVVDNLQPGIKYALQIAAVNSVRCWVSLLVC